MRTNYTSLFLSFMFFIGVCLLGCQAVKEKQTVKPVSGLNPVGWSPLLAVSHASIIQQPPFTNNVTLIWNGSSGFGYYSVEQTHDMTNWVTLTNCTADRTNYSVVVPAVGFTAWRVGVKIP